MNVFEDPRERKQINAPTNVRDFFHKNNSLAKNLFGYIINVIIYQEVSTLNIIQEPSNIISVKFKKSSELHYKLLQILYLCYG